MLLSVVLKPPTFWTPNTDTMKTSQREKHFLFNTIEMSASVTAAYGSFEAYVSVMPSICISLHPSFFLKHSLCLHYLQSANSICALPSCLSQYIPFRLQGERSMAGTRIPSSGFNLHFLVCLCLFLASACQVLMLNLLQCCLMQAW